MGAPAMAFDFTISAPQAASDAEATRLRAAVSDQVATLQQMVDRFAPEELKLIATHVQAVMQTPPPAADRAQDELISALTGGRRYSQAERIALEEAALARAFERRRTVLAGALTAAGVARLLGTSRQTPHDRVRSGTLLAVLDRGAWRFPAWQFDAEGPDGVIAGLPEVLRALHVSALAKVMWLTRPNPALRGETPLDALQRGQARRVLAAAQAVGEF